MNKDKKSNSSKYLAGASVASAIPATKYLHDYDKAVKSAEKFTKNRNKLLTAGMGSVIAGEGTSLASEVNLSRAIKKGKSVNHSVNRALAYGPGIGLLGSVPLFTAANNSERKAKLAIESAKKNRKLGVALGGASLGLGAASLAKSRMDKSASEIVDDILEKKAARAWKKNLGSLGEDSKKLLRDKDIWNYKREMAGLNKGTAEIIRKSDAQVSTGKYTNRLNNLISRRTGKLRSSNTLRPASAHIKTPDGKKSLDRVYLPHDEYINKLKGTDRKYADAITRRHEADELRVGRKIFKKDAELHSKGKKKGLAPTFGNSEATSYKNPYNGNKSNHNSPEVIHRESANIALAPDNVKKLFKDMREIDGEIPGGMYGMDRLIGKKISPVSSMARNPKIEYGKDAVINKKLMKRDKKELRGRFHGDAKDSAEGTAEAAKSLDMSGKLDNLKLDSSLGILAAGAGAVGYSARKKAKEVANIAKRRQRDKVMAGSALSALTGGALYNKSKDK